MKNLLPILALLLLVGCTSEPIELEFSYSEFLVQVESDQVLSVEFVSDNYTLKGKTVNGENFTTVRPPFLQDDLSETLSEHRVTVTGEKIEAETSGLQIFGLSIAALMGLFLLWIIPLILTVVVVFFVWRFLKKKVKD